MMPATARWYFGRSYLRHGCTCSVIFVGGSRSSGLCIDRNPSGVITRLTVSQSDAEQLIHRACRSRSASNAPLCFCHAESALRRTMFTLSLTPASSSSVSYVT